MGKYALREDFLKYRHVTRFPFPKGAAWLANIVQTVPTPKSDAEVAVTSHVVDACDGGSFRVFVYEPQGIQDDAPCLVYYHGGAFVLQAAAYHYGLAREYAMRAHCKVAFVVYRLAPRHAFPIPFEDSRFAYQWVVENAAQLRIDSHKVALAGDSAGGNLAANVALAVRDEGVVRPCFLMLVYPVVDPRMQTDSMSRYSDTPLWFNSANGKMWKLYLGGDCSEFPPYAAPILADSLEGLPDTYVETAEFDCLHDEGVEFAEALEKAGVRVELNNTVGTMHGFDIELQSSYVRACIAKRVSVLRLAFDQAG